MSMNSQRGLTLTIPAGAKVSNTVTLGCDSLLGLYVPTLDVGDLTVSGSVVAHNYDGSVLATGGPAGIVNELGSAILTFAATTGNFVLGAKALADLTGVSTFQVVSTATQSVDRVFVLSQKRPDR